MIHIRGFCLVLCLMVGGESLFGLRVECRMLVPYGVRFESLHYNNRRHFYYNIFYSFPPLVRACETRVLAWFTSKTVNRFTAAAA